MPSGNSSITGRAGGGEVVRGGVERAWVATARGGEVGEEKSRAEQVFVATVTVLGAGSEAGDLKATVGRWPSSPVAARPPTPVTCGTADGGAGLLSDVDICLSGLTHAALRPGGSHPVQLAPAA